MPQRIPLFLIAFVILSGCGSTIRGVGKDLSRVGRGVKMIFISEESEKPQVKQEKPSFSDFFKTQK